MITTGTFKVEASTLARIIMQLWVKNHIIQLALPPLILLFFGSLLDLRFVIVALMLVFVIIPPIMMTVYFYHAASPDARYSVLPHSLHMDEKGITFTYYPIDENTPARESETVDWEKIGHMQLKRDGFILTLSHASYSIIYVPSTAFENQKKMLSAEDFIIKNLHI